MSPPDIPNFRDAGGLATGSLRPGVVYRAPQLAAIDAVAQAALVDLGVTEVYDLRTADEVAHRPDDLPPSMRVTLLDILADRPHSGAAAVASLVTDKEDRATIEDVNDAVCDGRARDLMIETYRHFVSLPSAHAGYGTLLTCLASGAGAAIIHCTAGKDRTGWAIAVLQRLCGTSLDDVMADFLASNAGMEIAYRPMLDAFAAEGGDAQALGDMIFVRPEYLEAAIDLMHHVHGGLERYVTATLGMPTETLGTLRERLSA